MKSKHFKIYELVSPRVYDAFGEKAWMFIDPRLIATLDILRDAFGRPITINDWAWKGVLTQRGLRENVCDIVTSKTIQDQLYLSAHSLGMGADFDVDGYTGQYIRDQIKLLSSSLPYPIRLENDVPWIHMDVMTYNQDDNIYFFNK